ALVPKYLRETDVVLDIGTGGGERFLELSPRFACGLGVDVSPEMIAQARRNQAARSVRHVAFEVMDTFHLAVGDASFDVVLNRHCNVAVDEVVRVLRSGGLFITQQVASRNTENLLEAFGWTPASFGEDWWQPVAELATAFEGAGCRADACAEYDVRYWFLDVPSLLFWLKAVPLPEPFDLDRHWHGVNRILDRYTTDRGIETNEHRELLIVRKP
ncbi:MAG: class I SAM-dependent methyltransferase, partial [Anaerolineae bacterium]|nr:class I SAM-dependent methyltransferase [Anaerolineae bacterium]